MAVCARRVFALLLAQGAALVAASGEGAHSYEWAGSFATPGDDPYAWTMQIVDAAWADPSMKLAVCQIAGATDADLEAVEETAEALLAADPTACGVIGPNNAENSMKVGASTSAPCNCYTLTIDQDLYSNVFRLDLQTAQGGTGHTAFFGEHVPTEFERSAHYFIDKNGVDIEPLHELPEAAEQHKEYGGVIAACIVVNLCTLIGLLTMIPGIKGKMENPETREAWLVGSSAFAAGALLAAAGFLMIPEAVLLVNADEDLNEGAASARLGICLLAGFAVGLVVDATITYKGSGTAVAEADKPDEEVPAVGDAAASEVANTRMRTSISIFVGDFLHNMGDGFFIGAAFKVCGTSMGWTVAWGAFAHELAQELADFFVLVGPAGMKWWKAILLNVVSGLSVILVGIIMMASDVGNTATGLILVFGAGVYVYIGCVEAGPRAFAPTTPANQKLLALFLFVLGAAGIGFV